MGGGGGSTIHWPPRAPLPSKFNVPFALLGIHPRDVSGGERLGQWAAGCLALSLCGLPPVVRPRGEGVEPALLRTSAQLSVEIRWGGGELFEAPKKMFGLNQMAPKALVKNFHWPKARREIPGGSKGGGTPSGAEGRGGIKQHHLVCRVRLGGGGCTYKDRARPPPPPPKHRRAPFRTGRRSWPLTPLRGPAPRRGTRGGGSARRGHSGRTFLCALKPAFRHQRLQCGHLRRVMRASGRSSAPPPRSRGAFRFSRRKCCTSSRVAWMSSHWTCVEGGRWRGGRARGPAGRAEVRARRRSGGVGLCCRRMALPGNAVHCHGRAVVGGPFF